MRTLTKEIQESLTPQDALRLLVEGNERFVQNVKAERDLKEQVSETSDGQYPFAVVLSCIDSRGSAELVFDQGIGDIFSARVAGNIVNEDMLGSIEYACKVVRSKIVVVMGHTKCGAVTSACNDVELGNITPLLEKIKPAVDLVRTGNEKMSNDAIEEVSVKNIQLSIDRIRNESPILSEMERNKEIEIGGALDDVHTGEVEFLKNED